MNMTSNAPLDETHQMSTDALEVIRTHADSLRAGIEHWQPNPMPLGWWDRSNTLGNPRRLRPASTRRRFTEPEPDSVGTLEEVLPPRKWFRS